MQPLELTPEAAGIWESWKRYWSSLARLDMSLRSCFLDADDRVLVKRYKESRRSHPLAMYGRVDEGFTENGKNEIPERKSGLYHRYISPSYKRAEKEINRIFVDNGKFSNMVISVLSFGFKYGIPDDADLVFDVRFLPNPYYIDELRPHTGMDEDVFQYVMDCQAAADFADKLEDMVKFLIQTTQKKEKPAW